MPSLGLELRRVLFRSEEHTSELQSHSISYAVFCFKKKKQEYRVKTNADGYRVLRRNAQRSRYLLSAPFPALSFSFYLRWLNLFSLFFFLNKRAPTEIHPLPLPAPLPI